MLQPQTSPIAEMEKAPRRRKREALKKQVHACFSSKSSNLSTRSA